MVTHPRISKIIVVVMAVAVMLCFLTIGFSERLTELFGGPGVRMEYETKLFDTNEVMSVDIRMDESDWNKMLSNAISEEYYSCTVVINGKKISNVAIRPKGNTSLSSIAMDPDSNRFSLKLEFGHYEKGQTCYGLDKLILNNNYADATNMKEAIIYDMYQFIGAEASLWNYAKVSVNGEYWGVYLALEAVEDSFMLRNFGTQAGELYKPDSMEMGGDNSKNGTSSAPSVPSMPDSDAGSFDASGFAGMVPPSGAGAFPSDMPDLEGFSFDPTNLPDMESSGFDPATLPGMDSSGFDPANRPGADDFGLPGMGGFSFGGRGADLNYTDDDPDSYSLIWEGEITETGNSDHRRVVTALKNVCEGTNLEEYLDVDNVLKYMAVHTFSVNMDSLSGSMAHNYYLYEYKGRLNVFPWDYNLSFGGMSFGSDADATSMVNDAIDTPFSGTKFFDALLENEEYLECYHAYLRQLVDDYVNGGRFDEVYNRIRSQIDQLVETDPTAFYSFEEYQRAAELLNETVKLRAQSVGGQLDGIIPSTDEQQRRDSSTFVDASHIDLSAMGKFNMGGDFGDRPNRPNRDRKFGNPGSRPSAKRTDNSIGTQRPDETGNPNDRPKDFNPENIPGAGGSFPVMSGQSTVNVRTKNLITYGICLAVMLAFLIPIMFYRKRR